MTKPIHPPVYVGSAAVDQLVAFCGTRNIASFALLADANTYQAVGRRAEEALRRQGGDVLTIVLRGADIIADGNYVFDVMRALDGVPRTFVAAGSGTLTDITRFVSHRTGREFVSLPTAASVDGFTSVGAPMVIRGLKVTVPCHGPLAVFADLPVLCAAPQAMTAAGFGDMLAKLTSCSDWELGALLWDEPYDAEIARRSRAAAWACAGAVDNIAAAGCEGVQTLMNGLIESGFCMLDFGGTRPASGYEHHVSHLWEMKLLREGRHSILHGAKVGLAVVHSLRLYDALRRLPRADAEVRLARALLPNRETIIAGLRSAFGAAADEIMALQQPFLDMSETQYAALKGRVLAQWDDVQRIAQDMPTADQMTTWLRQVGGPADGSEVGLSAEEVAWALRWGHWFRPRFTIAKLAQMLGL